MNLLNNLPSLFLCVLGVLCLSFASIVYNGPEKPKPSGDYEFKTTVIKTEDLKSLRRWWGEQTPRHTIERPDGVTQIDGNAYESILNDEYRPRLGKILAEQLPGYGTCEHCHFPWALVDGHTVYYSSSRGIFAICEHCWDYLNKCGMDDQIRAHYECVRVRWSGDKVTKEQLAEAVTESLNKSRGTFFVGAQDPATYEQKSNGSEGEQP